MTILWLARHSRSIGNTSPYLTGNTDVPIDLAYAESTINSFNSFDWSRISYVFLSKLSRTWQTYELIKPEEPYIYTIESEFLNEQDFGKLTGKKRGFLDSDITKKQGETGESFIDVLNRVEIFIEQHHPFLADSLVIGHNNTLQALRCLLCDIPPEDLYGKGLLNGIPFYIETEKI